MDCQQALIRLADLSAESLEAPAAQTLMRHLAECPECEKEWQAFQDTLFRISAAPQPLPSPEQSRRIWAVCLEEISRDVEARRLGEQRQQGASGFFSFAPRWSWAALGGAAVVFGAVWFLAPQAATVAPAQPVQLADFELPPSTMTPLVRHHSTFAFDAFNDHTATSLLSIGATPATNAIMVSDTSDTVKSPR